MSRPFGNSFNEPHHVDKISTKCLFKKSALIFIQLFFVMCKVNKQAIHLIYGSLELEFGVLKLLLIHMQHEVSKFMAYSTRQ